MNKKMNDIQKMIEEEAEKKYLNLDDEDFLDFSDEEKLKAFKSGANFVLHANRWRKVSEELPEYNQNVLLKFDNDKVLVGWYTSEEYFDCDYILIEDPKKEWKPIY